MKYNRDLRNKVGMVLAFVLGVLFNSLGVIIMAFREKYQSVKGHFPLESDDLFRYSILGGFGALINTVLICILCFKVN